ncbi:MAG: YhdT family protein [Oscillibacter sp.]|nr:YhdT family protein [Oscillibacter sp.]
MEKMTYKEKFIQMNKEAKATWIVAAIIIVYWFLSGFGVYAVWGAEWTILGMPAWFVLSCFGSWILSMVLVALMVKKVFKDFDLEEEDIGKKEG